MEHSGLPQETTHVPNIQLCLDLQRLELQSHVSKSINL